MSKKKQIQTINILNIDKNTIKEKIKISYLFWWVKGKETRFTLWSCGDQPWLRLRNLQGDLMGNDQGLKHL
jgi:hypothetical protein